MRRLKNVSVDVVSEVVVVDKRGDYELEKIDKRYVGSNGSVHYQILH